MFFCVRTYNSGRKITLRIRQILINLLTNALKYTSTGGRIEFSARQSALENGLAKFVFTISDTGMGMGMSAEFQKNMYNSFSRGTDSRVNKIQGSGLGLAIVKQMVTLMEGTIECQSAVGKGTTFTVTLTLPLDSVQSSSVAADSSLTKDEFAGMRILVAEDNDINWEVINVLLDEYGIKSDRAADGKECVALLQNPESPHYDCILMDIQMPVMNGREAAKIIRSSKNSYLQNIPIIAMTADAFAEDVFACLESGMDAHISKPIDMTQVLTLLKKVKNGILRRKED